MRRVSVLMSTYNGEKYLKEQLDSIYRQKSVEVMLYVRDDGSNDSTIQILEEYKSTYGKMVIIKGENVGSARSFYKLVQESALTDGEYFAFSDQDDIWHLDKLEAAITKIEEKYEGPKMYFSNLNVVNKDGKFIKRKISSNNPLINKSCALVQNYATGCTIVCNRKAILLFLRHDPKYLIMHDYWMYLICIYLGTVIYDDRAFIDYRQHGNNVIGAKQNMYSVWKSRIKSFKKLNDHPRELAMQELIKGYKDMLNEEDNNVISIVADFRKSLPKRAKLFFNNSIRMEGFDRNFWLRIRILFGSV